MTDPSNIPDTPHGYAVLSDGSHILLGAGVVRTPRQGSGIRTYHPSVSGKGNPWHDQRTGEFTWGPPGMRILRGKLSLHNLPNTSKRLIDKYRKAVPMSDAITADTIGSRTVVHMFHGPRVMAKFDVPSTEPGKKDKKGQKGLPGDGKASIENDPVVKAYHQHHTENLRIEMNRHASGRKHLTQSEKDYQQELRKQLDVLIRAGVYRKNPQNILEEIEISRARAGRKHYNKEEWAKLDKFRKEEIQKLISWATPILEKESHGISPRTRSKAPIDQVGDEIDPARMPDSLKGLLSDATLNRYNDAVAFGDKERQIEFVRQANKMKELATSTELPIPDHVKRAELATSLFELQNHVLDEDKLSGRVKHTIRKTMEHSGFSWDDLPRQEVLFISDAQMMDVVGARSKAVAFPSGRIVFNREYFPADIKHGKPASDVAMALGTVLHEASHLSMHPNAIKDSQDYYMDHPAGAFIDEAMTETIARIKVNTLYKEKGLELKDRKGLGGEFHPLDPEIGSYPENVGWIDRAFISPFQRKLMEEGMNPDRALEHAGAKLSEIYGHLAHPEDRLMAMEHVLRAHGLDGMNHYDIRFGLTGGGVHSDSRISQEKIDDIKSVYNEQVKGAFIERPGFTVTHLPDEKKLSPEEARKRALKMGKGYKGKRFTSRSLTKPHQHHLVTVPKKGETGKAQEVRKPYVLQVFPHEPIENFQKPTVDEMKAQPWKSSWRGLINVKDGRAVFGGKGAAGISTMHDMLYKGLKAHGESEDARYNDWVSVFINFDPNNPDKAEIVPTMEGEGWDLFGYKFIPPPKGSPPGTIWETVKPPGFEEKLQKFGEQRLKELFAHLESGGARTRPKSASSRLKELDKSTPHPMTHKTPTSIDDILTGLTPEERKQAEKLFKDGKFQRVENVRVDESAARQALDSSVDELLGPGPDAQGAKEFLHEAFDKGYGLSTEGLRQKIASAGVDSQVVIKPDVHNPLDTLADPTRKVQPAWYVEVGEGDGVNPPPGFTVFTKEDGSYHVDDVISVGDEDFFTNEQTQTDYFAVIDAIRGNVKEGYITLHRGMDPREYEAWKKGEQIPTGKFFTTRRTTEYATDVSGEFPKLYSFKVHARDVVETDDGTYQLIRAASFKDGKIEAETGKFQLPKPVNEFPKSMLDEFGFFANKKDFDNVKAWIRNEGFDKTWNDLPELEKMAVDAYTGIGEIMSIDSTTINDILYGGKHGEQSAWESPPEGSMFIPKERGLDPQTVKNGNVIIDRLTSALDRHELKEDLVVYRGVREREIDKFNVGDTYTEPGFMSTTLSRDTAEGYAPSVMKIRLPAGSKGMFISEQWLRDLKEWEKDKSWGQDLEMLLQRDTKFKYVGKDEYGDHTFEAQLERGKAQEVTRTEEWTRDQVEERKSWVEPPPAKGEKGQKEGAGGYTSDAAFPSLTKMGFFGESLFRELTGGQDLHPEGAHGRLDVRVDGYGFEVKSVSTESTKLAAALKSAEMLQKHAEAERLGVDPAVALVVVDRESNTAFIYWRPGLKGGVLHESKGWKHMGTVNLEKGKFQVPSVNEEQQRAQDALLKGKSEKRPGIEKVAPGSTADIRAQYIRKRKKRLG